MSQLSIAVVIVTFNRVTELQKTIDAIFAQGIALGDVFVINNNSTDATKEMLASDYPEAQVFHLEENIASAGGFSMGMQIAHKKGYRWVWLFNDDSRPVTGSLISIADHIDTVNEAKVGLLKIGNDNGKGEAVLLFWKGVRHPVYTPLKNELIPTDLVTFDGCMISAELMDQIGYCDPAYFMGTYEFDYCLKAKDAGFGIYTVPNGLIEDGKLGSADGGTPPWRQYYNTRNHLWLGLNRKSIQICKAWFIRELKLTYAIMRYGNRKPERLLFKMRAVRDAVLNRRGRIYNPSNYRN